MTRRLFLIAIIAFFSSMQMNAQKVKNIVYEYVYHQSDDESQSMAKAKAVKYAQNEGIAKVFGTLIHNQSIIRIEGDKVSHLMLGENEVKAQWIKDNNPPKFSFAIDPVTGRQLITVKVDFVAREIISQAIQVDAQLLRNGTTEKFKDNTFFSEDQLFLHFKSPVSGYLLVYEQGEDAMVRRLLPYSRSNKTAYYVEGNKDYVFFSKDHRYFEKSIDDVDEILFYTDKRSEYGRICIIFSPHSIARPIDMNGSEVMGGELGFSNDRDFTFPNQLPFEKFQEWLSSSRLKDIRINYMPIDIEIKSRK